MLSINVDFDRRIFSVHETLAKVKPRLRWNIQYSGAIISGDTHMAFMLPDNKSATISFQALDAAGQPAKIDGLPTFSVVDPTIATITPSADGLTAILAPTLPIKLGSTQVQVSVDADLGEGVTTITGLLDVEVAASEAVSLNVTAVLNP
ncbi:MAG: hypothetical protein PHQ40_17260 [Anaerolineaceae bacterium]|nr:hypothetical protein [Anaerolineaceae bacterium]